ncbi:hypothetical protein [Desertivirga brevis]|uniref:hypothetical protein n=1 Tax=Desertivirga brevis TaxID=2810310 RepID=UPI001A95951D|nr:hypothetical protein [Pedobacter sp. SYSU D00873]
MKPVYIYIITVGTILSSLYFGDRLFKLQHSEQQVYHVQNFKVKDSVFVDDAVVFTGKNIFGVQEAILVPGPESTENFMYIYLRFSPEWFNANLKPRLKVGWPNRYKAENKLFDNVVRWHKNNLKRVWHINDFPVIVPGNEVVVLLKEAYGGDLKEYIK